MISSRSVYLSVCLSVSLSLSLSVCVCVQNISKGYERILMNFFGEMGVAQETTDWILVIWIPFPYFTQIFTP